MQICKSEQFEKWFGKESKKSQYQIASRLARIVQYDYFGDHKLLGKNLAELRWKCGRRIYYTIYKNKGNYSALVFHRQNNDLKKIKKHALLYERKNIYKIFFFWFSIEIMAE